VELYLHSPLRLHDVPLHLNYLLPSDWYCFRNTCASDEGHHARAALHSATGTTRPPPLSKCAMIHHSGVRLHRFLFSCFSVFSFDLFFCFLLVFAFFSNVSFPQNYISILYRHVSLSSSSPPSFSHVLLLHFLLSTFLYIQCISFRFHLPLITLS